MVKVLNANNAPVTVLLLYIISLYYYYSCINVKADFTVVVEVELIFNYSLMIIFIMDQSADSFLL